MRKIIEKLSILKKWLLKDTILKQNLTFDEILKSFALIIPIEGILYLYFYYNSFSTHYFLYFNPIDFITVFYANNAPFLFFLPLVGVLIIPFYFYSNFFYSFKFKTNAFLTLLFIVAFGIAFYFYLQYFNPFVLAIIGMVFIIYFIGVSTKNTRSIYYSLVFCHCLFSMRFAKDNALATKKDKPSFNIILNDNSFALKENKIENKDYFIGKITNYVFVYSDSVKKVRAIPVSHIKEIQFPLK